MSRIILKSNYKKLEKGNNNCISLKWNALTKGLKIKHIISDEHKMIRLLLDNNTDTEQDENIIKYLIELYNQNPDLGFHINVEDQRCFEKAKKIISKVPFKEKSIKLFPDKLLRDRTNLNLKELNCITIIPLQYAMWHNDIESANIKYLRFDRCDNSEYDGSLPFNEFLNREFDSKFYDLKKVLEIKKIVLKILDSDLKLKGLHNDLQKALLISDYMSKNITYTNYEKLGTSRIKVVDRSGDHEAGYTLLNKEGVCEGQAEAFMLLLNNPIINIDCRIQGGFAYRGELNSGHSWNILRLKESKYYYIFDQTWEALEVQKKNLKFKYSFLTFIPERDTLIGTEDYYEIAYERIPEDFLELQLEDAFYREKNCIRVLPIRNLDELLEIYRQKNKNIHKK